MIQTECGKLYTGITTDIARRYQEHCDVYAGLGIKGAKFFRGHKPEKIIHSETYGSRSKASKREYEIKAMTLVKKRMLVNNAAKTRIN